MTITLTHVPLMRSLRPLWLLEELGAPYDLDLVQRDEVKARQQDASFLGDNPLAKFPMMRDGDLVMVESIAIMEYILTRHGPGDLVPAQSTDDFGTYLQWLHFGEATLGHYAVLLMGHTVFLPEEKRVPGIARWARAETRKCLSFMDRTLRQRDYLCAHGFTAADISVSYMLFILKLIRELDDAPESVLAYWARVTERPAWQKVSRLGM